MYVRWMPHIGAEAVALYELLRVLPDVGQDAIEVEELAELLRSTPEGVEEAFEALEGAGFVVEREGWLEVAEHPPAGSMAGRSQEVGRKRPRGVVRGEATFHEASVREAPVRDVQVVRAEPEGVSADDYFRFMGTLPAPHILEFLNGYCGRDGLTPDAVREALKIASERDARRVGYVRSILERWVERGVKTVEDVERFERDRKLRLVEESGATKGGALKVREGGARRGVRGGEDRQSAARRREGYEWLFGEEG
ncbi:MAG: DNA replication protein DnaD [uncultured Rubrobacteraceae bacterium]|uniref:DNA replication protein DnaD n=1 Tax=uncultured Rubrobacteraceae bacterium TaxID=349277 RepID=A0A6J4RAQ3_9ACTN|nr:MAG: DNA replication protein DnaD [uncultured Rubrobacteraceae bacterium]